MASIGGTTTLVNCTLTGNSADGLFNPDFGGGVGGGIGGGIAAVAAATIENCILWGNSASDEGQEIILASSTLVVRYSDVQGGEAAVSIEEGGVLSWQEGNIDAEPLFAGGEDFRLTEGSPCIDTGNPSPAYNDGCLSPALGGDRNDMGAYGGPLSCCWTLDEDGDGYRDDRCGGDDCTDSNATIYPGAEEVCEGGLDEDCDTLLDGDDPDCEYACWDLDGDGYDTEACAGEDCNDADPEIRPGAVEICNDLLDNDCDGGIDIQDDACDAVVGLLNSDGTIVATGGEVARSLTDVLPVQGTLVQIAFGLDIEGHRSWRVYDVAIDRVLLSVDSLTLSIDGDFRLTGEVDFELSIQSAGVEIRMPASRGSFIDLTKYADGERVVFIVNAGTTLVGDVQLDEGDWLLFEAGEVVAEGSLSSKDFPPVPGGCIDQDEDRFALDGGDCGIIDCDDDPATCGAACHPFHLEILGDGYSNDCDALIDEPRYGDLGPFREGDGEWAASDFNVSAECVRWVIPFTDREAVFLDVAPFEICDSLALPIVIAPNPDGRLDRRDLSVLLQAAAGYCEILPTCP